MADNRLWLCHRPTGLAVCIGKRLGFPFGPHTGIFEDLCALYEKTQDMDQPENFVLLNEALDTGWEYTMEFDGHLRKINFK